MQINIQKIIYLNCGERYEVMINHYSYTHNLSSCEIKAELSRVKSYANTSFCSKKFPWLLIT